MTFSRSEYWLPCTYILITLKLLLWGIQVFPHCSLRSFLTVPVPWGFQQDVPFSSGRRVPLLTQERTAAGIVPRGHPPRGSFSDRLCAPTAPLEGNHTSRSVWFCKAGHSLVAGRASTSLSQHGSSPCPESPFGPPLSPVCMRVSDPAVLTVCCSG